MIAQRSKAASPARRKRMSWLAKLLLGIPLLCHHAGCVEKTSTQPTGGTPTVPLKTSRSRGATADKPVTGPEPDGADKTTLESDADSN